MIDQQFGNQSAQDIRISPYASSSHNRGIGHGNHTLRKHSFAVIAPLLFVGACTAVAVAAFSNSTTSQQSPKASQTSASTVTTNQDSSSPSVHTTDPAAPDQNSGSSANINVKSTESNNGKVNASVTVNGQPVDVPENGAVSNTITNPDGSTSSYSVSTATNGSSTNFSSSMSSMSVSSNTSSWDGNGASVHGTTIVNGVPYSY